jgi:hypothetical protein
MMEVLRSSETSVLARATWSNIPEEGIFKKHRNFNDNYNTYLLKI